LKEKDEIVRLVTEDLRVLVGLSGKPTYTHSFCWPRAIPQYNVGYDKFKMLMEKTEKRAAGVFIGGHCRDGISLGESIISGYNAAGRIENYIKST